MFLTACAVSIIFSGHVSGSVEYLVFRPVSELSVLPIRRRFYHEALLPSRGNRSKALFFPLFYQLIRANPVHVFPYALALFACGFAMLTGRQPFTNEKPFVPDFHKKKRRRMRAA